MRLLDALATAVGGRRTVEATSGQLAATGAAYGGGYDPIDGDTGWRQLGVGPTDMPSWTLDKARAYSIAAYRSNPMARAVIDTYTSFCVGDVGVGYHCSNPEVRAMLDRWWTDPRNELLRTQTDFMRSHLLLGETVLEALVGAMTGVVRYSMISPGSVERVNLLNGNPLWHDSLTIRRNGMESLTLPIVAVDDISNLYAGRALFKRSWNALMTDRRGVPFLTPISDALDSFDATLNNLVDRTALMRYIALDVTIEGDDTDVENFIRTRGGTHLPRSGTIEVHNDKVTWKALDARPGAYEDQQTLGQLLTNVAGGAGLAKTWLADPEGANRATAMSMAEPVRRRVDGVQAEWLGFVRLMAQHAIDEAVRARMLPLLVDATDPRTNETTQIMARETVRIIGPEIAANDSQVTAAVMLNLGQAIETMRNAGVLGDEAAQLLVQRAWEQFTGLQWRADLAVRPDETARAVADRIDEQTAAQRPLRAVPPKEGTA